MRLILLCRVRIVYPGAKNSLSKGWLPRISEVELLMPRAPKALLHADPRDFGLEPDAVISDSERNYSR